MSNEEFKSSNEELQSTNEELQSTNEELETTKEELQSLNEELITVNAQLQNKFEEAASANDDLKNLVNSTEVATIFLDDELRIKRFTPGASRVSKVIATDIGRPFGDIVSTVRYDGLLDDARTVLQTLVFKEREVQAEDGHWYLLRIVPYRTSKNLIDGVVLTYLEITAYKRGDTPCGVHCGQGADPLDRAGYRSPGGHGQSSHSISCSHVNDTRLSGIPSTGFWKAGSIIRRYGLP